MGIAVLPSGAPAALAFRYGMVIPYIRQNRRKDLFKGRLLWGLLFCLLVYLLHWHSGMEVTPYMRQNRRMDLFNW